MWQVCHAAVSEGDLHTNHTPAAPGRMGLMWLDLSLSRRRVGRAMAEGRRHRIRHRPTRHGPLTRVRYSVIVTRSPSESPSGEATVNEQGRVTIPAQVRRAAGIDVGMPLVVYVEDGRIVIETREQLANRIRRDVAAAWTGAGSVVDELIADRRAEAAREDRQ